MEQINILTRGGIYLAKLDPAKEAEVGKIRPIVLLTAQTILNIAPPIVFICPLSSQSYPKFEALHIKLAPRDNLKVTSYALVEHCRSISTQRIIFPRLAQLTHQEITILLQQLQQWIDF